MRFKLRITSRFNILLHYYNVNQLILESSDWLKLSTEIINICTKFIFINTALRLKFQIRFTLNNILSRSCVQGTDTRPRYTTTTRGRSPSGVQRNHTVGRILCKYMRDPMNFFDPSELAAAELERRVSNRTRSTKNEHKNFYAYQSS